MSRLPAARVWVESWPAGGYVVRIADHDRPISHHDTEEEARARAHAYARGLMDEAQREHDAAHSGAL